MHACAAILVLLGQVCTQTLEYKSYSTGVSSVNIGRGPKTERCHYFLNADRGSIIVTFLCGGLFKLYLV